MSHLIQVAIARGFHLFPFRTEKLSLVTPMVLRNSGRVGSCRFLEKPPIQQWVGGFLFCIFFFFFFFLQTCVCLFSMCSRKYGSECTSLVQLSFRYFISSLCCRDAGICCLRTHCEVLYWSYSRFFSNWLLVSAWGSFLLFSSFIISMSSFYINRLFSSVDRLINSLYWLFTMSRPTFHGMLLTNKGLLWKWNITIFFTLYCLLYMIQCLSVSSTYCGLFYWVFIFRFI